jgi:hypothetical protein
MIFKKEFSSKHFGGILHWGGGFKKPKKEVKLKFKNS